MSKSILTPAKLTPAAESAILSQFPWLPNGKVRVTCTIRSEALLRKAGIDHPKPLESYDLNVRRDESGFLTLNPYCRQTLVESSDDSLFERGGLFAGESPIPRPPIAPSDISARAELATLREMPCTRTFEITIGSHEKIRVQVVGFVDSSLPSPSEVEKWHPKKPTNTDVHAAVSALYMSRHLPELEQV